MRWRLAKLTGFTSIKKSDTVVAVAGLLELPTLSAIEYQCGARTKIIMQRGTTSQSASASVRNGLAQEVLWMRAALAADDLNIFTFHALLRLLTRWSDAQLLALASAVFSGRAFRSRLDALRTLETVHRRRSVALLLELEDLLA
jgi:hypothetical protein